MKKFVMTLMLLVSVTAAFAIDFPSYSGVSRRYYDSDYRVQTTPVVHLQSRQAEEADEVKRIGFSSLTTAPQLSEDGYIVSTVDEYTSEESSASSGRANRGRTERVGTPDDRVVDGQLPLGSPLIPLVLFAMGYMAFIAYSRLAKKKE